MHWLHIFLIKLPLFGLRHVHPSNPVHLFHHVNYIQLEQAVQVMVDRLNQGAGLHLAPAACIEAIHIAVEYMGTCKHVLHAVCALLPLDQQQEVRICQGRDEPPVIRVAGCDYEGIHMVLVMLPAGPGGQLDTHQGFLLLHPLYQTVFYRYPRERLKHFSGPGGMHIIEQDVTLIFRNPIYIHLIGVILPLPIIDCRRCRSPLFRIPVRHDEDILYILPINPQREKPPAVIHPLGNKPINHHDMLI